ncbi:MAG: hypothetical protein Q8P22_03300 [Chloroflexota bacterium]|nr:hypothetical protein [Chloroflexota bacterium]
MRTMLEVGGVGVLDLDMDGLLESIEHDEGTVQALLNLVVRTHVAHLLLKVHMPCQDDEWTQYLRNKGPTLRMALDKCHEALAALPTVGESAELGIWQRIVPALQGLPTWEDVKGAPIGKGFDSLVTIDGLLSEFIRTLEIRDEKPAIVSRDLSQGLYEFWGTCVIEGIPLSYSLTAWHILAARFTIERIFARTDLVDMSVWQGLVDLCDHVFMSVARTAETYPVKRGNTKVEVSPLSKEFWAWQFGRVAAVGSLLEESELTDPKEYGYPYSTTSLYALGLLLGAGKSIAWQGRWTGALATAGQIDGWDPDLDWGKEEMERSVRADFVSLADITPKSHLFWLMQLGVADGLQHLQAPTQTSQRNSTMPPSVVEELAEALALKEQRNQHHAHDFVKERLGSTWDALPDEAKEHLLAAESSYLGKKLSDASADFARAVEAALDGWRSRLRVRLQKPYPSLKDWAECIEQKLNTPESRDLSSCLRLLGRARLSRVHAGAFPSMLILARKVALGIERPSVFELLRHHVVR